MRKDVSAADVREALARPKTDMDGDFGCAIHFVLFQVSDDPISQVGQHLTKATRAAIQSGARIESIMSTLCLATCDHRTHPRPSPTAASAVADAVLAACGSNVRIVWGLAEGFFGLVGSPERLHFGSVLPGFDEALLLLMRTEFGSARRVNKE